MKRIRCVNQGVLERNDGLWWLKKEHSDSSEKSSTPMSIALRNGEISKVIDVKLSGLSTYEKRQGIF